MDPITNQLSVGTQQQAQPTQQSSQMQLQGSQPVAQTAVGGLTQANPTLGTQSVANPAQPSLLTNPQMLQTNPLLSSVMQPGSSAGTYATPSPTPTYNQYNFDPTLTNYLNQWAALAALDAGQWNYDPQTQMFTLQGAFMSPGAAPPTMTLAQMQERANAAATQQAYQTAALNAGQTIYQPSSALMSNMSNFSTNIQNYLKPLGGAQLTSNQSYTYDPASQTFYLNEVSPFGPGTSTPITMAEMQAKADAFAAQAANNPLLGQTIYQPNAAGTMQQMPVGQMPGRPMPIGGMAPTGMAPPPPPQLMNTQGALSRLHQRPMYQNNPMLQQTMARMQGNPMFQQFMNQQGMGGPFGRFGGGFPPYGQPMMGRRFGYGRMQDEERDQYGNPVARPVMYDYGNRMPELMQRYGMM